MTPEDRLKAVKFRGNVNFFGTPIVNVGEDGRVTVLPGVSQEKLAQAVVVAHEEIMEMDFALRNRAPGKGA